MSVLLLDLMSNHENWQKKTNFLYQILYDDIKREKIIKYINVDKTYHYIWHIGIGEEGITIHVENE